MGVANNQNEMTPMEETSKIAVIFDTNSYRQFSRDKSVDELLQYSINLKKAEARKNIKCNGSVIVAMELLSHLNADKNNLNYIECLNSLIVLANHCFDDDTNQQIIFPHAYLQITHSLFQRVPPEVLKNVESLGGVINDFRKNVDKAITHHESHLTFENVSNYIYNLEAEFVQQIVNLIDGVELLVKSKNPTINNKHLREKKLKNIDSNDFKEMMSLAIVKAMAIKMNLNISQNELNKMSKFMLDTFPVASGFYQWICKKIVDKNIDMYSKNSKIKRWNWLWDYHASFGVSKSTLGGRNVLFVTSDDDLTKILSDFGFGDKVMDLEEYLLMIEYKE